MSASLVGSEMCIRDSRRGRVASHLCLGPLVTKLGKDTPGLRPFSGPPACLLYTSDAADDM
eukprot:6953171-Alexandrium_andersonii.AAC.1